ncbi:MAG: TrbI/VirB10 family protein [Alphaproteobacteria bacterium]
MNNRPDSTPVPSDPLERRRVITSGPHIARILLVLTVAVGLGLAAYMLGRSQGAGGVLKAPILLDRREPDAKLPSYADLAAPPSPAPPPTPRFEAPKASPAPAKPQAHSPAKEDELRKKALEAGVGGWSRKEPDEAAPAGVPGRTDVAAAGSDCLVPPGTPIAVQTISRVVTERGGIVTAQITRDVWDAGFVCLAVPAGSLVTMEIGATVTKGQKRIAVAKPVITRPWPRNDTVQLVAMAADATGASGLPGTVEVPWVGTGLLIAASTAVDLASAALTGGGGLLGTILGRGMESPLDRAAKDLLERAPVITLEAGEPLLLVLRGALRADDFRS